jgi:hypothetical protein
LLPVLAVLEVRFLAGGLVDASRLRFVTLAELVEEVGGGGGSAVEGTALLPITVASGAPEAESWRKAGDEEGGDRTEVAADPALRLARWMASTSWALLNFE